MVFLRGADFELCRNLSAANERLALPIGPAPQVAQLTGGGCQNSCVTHERCHSGLCLGTCHSPPVLLVAAVHRCALCEPTSVTQESADWSSPIVTTHREKKPHSYLS